MTKIDISSTVLEKGVDLAKSFLDKLITPAIEETGLLIRDRVTLWKFKNQVKMLNKAKEYCEKHNVPLKTISLKLLCPLLDYSALEEDEYLQSKWAILLANLVDSRMNIENHVFPYVLSQISKEEFILLDKVYTTKVKRIKQLNEELIKFQIEKPKIEQDLIQKVKETKDKIIERSNSGPYTGLRPDLQKELNNYEWDLSSLKYKESGITWKINQPEVVPDNKLKQFEISNLVRLGLIKEVQEIRANSQTLKIPNDRDEAELTVDLNVEVESSSEFILTELGELFIIGCKEKE